MASPSSPSSPAASIPVRGTNYELSEEGRNALAVRYALALTPGKERLPKDVGSALAEEFGGSNSYPRQLWARVKEQLEDGHTLSLASKGRAGRPSDFTPRKQAKIRRVSAENRSITLEQLSVKLAEAGLVAGSSKLHRWIKAMEAKRVHRRVTPKLTMTYKLHRVDFILSQVAKSRKTFVSGFKAIHSDESWFYLIRDGERVCMFLGEERVGSTNIQYKSHIPKVMFICAVSRLDQSRDFDGKIGIWRVCVIKRAQRSTARRNKGDEYEWDVNVDADWYQEWYTEIFLPEVQDKMPCLKGAEAIVQQDGASPHTGKGTPQKLNKAGREGRVELRARDAAGAVARPQHQRLGAIRVP